MRYLLALFFAFSSVSSAFAWNQEGLASVEAFAFSNQGSKPASPAFRTDALYIVSGGKVLVERYARDNTATTRHYGWSISKSFSMAILGVAAKQGLISLDDTVTKWIPEAKKEVWSDVKLEHLLTMSSGTDWDEGYEGSPFKSDVVAALYRKGKSDNIPRYVLTTSKKLAPPGTRLNYSSGDTNLLMYCLSRALGTRKDSFAWDEFFTPAGFTSVVMERDREENVIGSSYMHASARDFARLGELFLNSGKVKSGNGKQIQLLSADWAKLAATPSPALPELGKAHTTQELYGHGWWLNRSIPEKKIKPAFPNLPEDAVIASGHYGQMILVIPSWDVVVVRLGSDQYGMKFDVEHFTALLREAKK